MGSLDTLAASRKVSGARGKTETVEHPKARFSTTTTTLINSQNTTYVT